MDIELLASAEDLAEDDWAAMESRRDPFLTRGFLAAAEQTGAAGPELSWQAQHIALKENGLVIGVLPAYLRQHSFGDFSRDWNWAAAWQRAGLPYYPKLVSGIPYTPSPGPRLLVRRGMARNKVAPLLADAAPALAAQLGASSWQCLFVDEEDRQLLEERGLLMRRGVQFHWSNRGYVDFDAFLAGFVSAKRKKIRRERCGVANTGLQMDVRHGDEMDRDHWTTVHRQYASTFHRYGNHPAFSEDFFVRVSAALARNVVVFMARRDNRVVASAICYRDDETLYGRHWGTELDVPGLHFELCYYQGIEYCIRHGLARFEPGAQGEHKLARGFEPSPTWSAFWIADPGMRRAVADFVRREDLAMQDYAEESSARLPYRLARGENGDQ